jgi:hypothetical protein
MMNMSRPWVRVAPAVLSLGLLSACTTAAPLPSPEIASHLKAVDLALAAYAAEPEDGLAADAAHEAARAAAVARERAHSARNADRRLMLDIAASVEACRRAAAAVAARNPTAELLALSAARETCSLAAATDALLAR